MNNLKFSIIVPTLNQSSKLHQCLDRLSFLSFDPRMFEVLIIDNGSSDETKDVSLSFQGKIRNLRYLYCAEPGLMAARHMGYERAVGEILCYLDDDSLVTPDWLSGHEESFADETVVIAGGPCIPKYESEPPKWTKYFWVNTEFGKTNTFLSLLEFKNTKMEIPPWYIYGCNYAIRRKTFSELGGTCPDYYPEKYREFQGDGESALAMKIFYAGYKAVYNPKSQIDHLISPSRLTVEYFCWRRFFNGIHASYRAIRQQYGVDNLNITNMGDTNYNVRNNLKRLKRKVSRIFTLVKNINHRDPKDITYIKKRIEESYVAGYSFHQNMVRNNPKLLAWILRPNYMGENSKLPVQKSGNV